MEQRNITIKLLFVFLASFFSFTFVSSVKAQEFFSEDSTFIKAEKLFHSQNYNEALNSYLKIYPSKKDDPLLNYKIALCYLYSDSNKTEALQYLELINSHLQSGKISLGSKGEKIPIEFYYNLGRVYYHLYRFDDAIEAFNKYKTISTKNTYKNDVAAQIKMCTTARDLINNPLKVTISNLGPEINSPFSEHSPLTSADGMILFFTSKRIGLQDTSNENIYMSFKLNDEWTVPVSIGAAINTKEDEISLRLSSDGERLFIYKGNMKEHNIYFCTLKDNNWTTPQSIYDQKNLESNVTDSVLYFASDQSEGYGGKDIFKIQRLPNGSWGLPQNVGPTINTDFDEDSPTLTADGKTLYFSSKGHNTMGGYDIFYSTLYNDTWAAPQNIGYPINTLEDDASFTLSLDGKYAYYASAKEFGFGDKDIYAVLFQEEKNSPLTILKGIISYKDNPDTVVNAKIKVVDMESNEVIGIYKPNSTTGKYLLILLPGKNYNIIFEEEGYLFHSEKLYIKDQFIYQQKDKPVELVPINR